MAVNRLQGDFNQVHLTHALPIAFIAIFHQALNEHFLNAPSFSKLSLALNLFVLILINLTPFEVYIEFVVLNVLILIRSIRTI